MLPGELRNRAMVELFVGRPLTDTHHGDPWTEPRMGPAPPRVFDSERPSERKGSSTRIEADVTSTRSLVAVVDDSESVRESLPDLLEQVGYAVEAFESAEAFLESGAANAARCLILDVGLPGMSGPDLQQELK